MTRSTLAIGTHVRTMDNLRPDGSFTWAYGVIGEYCAEYNTYRIDWNGGGHDYLYDVELEVLDEYTQKEQEFMARTDALCEDAPPATCDCAICPCKELCDWLCTNNPNKKEV